MKNAWRLVLEKNGGGEKGDGVKILDFGLQNWGWRRSSGIFKGGKSGADVKY